LKNGDLADIQITDLTSAGNGVGRCEGMVVFVPGSVPGDLVRVSVTGVSRNHAQARIIKVLVPSAERIEPPCKYAYKCGGCSFQFMSYASQIKWKQTNVLETLVRIGGSGREYIESVMREIISSDDPFRYRNKVQMPVGRDSSSSVAIGFYEYNSHKIVDGDSCLIQHGFADKVRELFRKAISDGLIEPYDEVSGNGLLRHLMIRIGYFTGQAMVVAVLSRKEFEGVSAIRDKIIMLAESENIELTAYYANINPVKGNTVLGDEFILLDQCGSGYIEEKILGLTFRISPTAFFQVNTQMASRLFAEVIEFSGLKGDEHVIDLYCGTGSISLLLAGKCAKVTGIEIVERAIDDARINAEINGIDNVEFYCGRSEVLLPEFVSRGIRTDLIVLDPPRKGCERAVLDAMLQASPSKIIYVSCDPSTLARDCRILCGGGEYDISAVRPVDLFPWTGHVETVVLMSRVKDRKS